MTCGEDPSITPIGCAKCDLSLKEPTTFSSGTSTVSVDSNVESSGSKAGLYNVISSGHSRRTVTENGVTKNYVDGKLQGTEQPVSSAGRVVVSALALACAGLVAMY